YIHRRTQSHRFQSAKNLDGCCVITVSCFTADRSCFFCHILRAPAELRGKVDSTAALPCDPQRRSRLGLVGFLLHPVRIPITRKRTWRRLHSSRLVSSRLP